MVILVVISNLIIALINFWLAWQIWKLRKSLIRWRKTLIKCERNSHRLFYPAPEIITQGEDKVHRLRANLRKLQLQVEQLQKLVRILALGYRIWRRQSGPQRLLGVSRKRKYA